LNAQESTQKGLWFARILQLAGIAAVLIYGDVLYRWPLAGDVSFGVGWDSHVLKVVTIIAAFLGLITLANGFFIINLMIKTRKVWPLPVKKKILFFILNVSNLDGAALGIQILRLIMFIALAAYGFVLGILGAQWQFTLPFLGVAALALAFTFPTQKRWERLLARFKENADGHQ
jgi:hypothetical protein